MSIALSIFGVLLGFVMLIVLTYKGLHLSWVSILVALVLMVTSGLAIGSSWDDQIGKGIGMMAGTLIPLFLAGATFGKLVSVTGAADSFAKTVLRALTGKLSDPKKRLVGAFLIIMMGILMAYAGIDNFAILFTQIAIAASIMHEVNIPRRFIAVLIILGSTIGGALPGTPSIMNIIAVQFLVDTSAMAAPALAIPGGIIILVFSLWGMSKMWEKDVAAGKKFEFGPLTHAKFDEENLPPWFFLLIPVGVVFVCYNILHLNPFFSLLCGLAISVLLLFKYMPYDKESGIGAGTGKLKSLTESFNNGAEIAGIPAIILINMALGNLISATPAFQWMVDGISSMKGVINPYILFSFISMSVIGISASMSGLIVMFNLARDLFIPVMGISTVAAHRLVQFSGMVLDTLPFGTMVVAILLLTGIKHKEGYPPILFSTVGVTFLATVVLTILSIIIY